MKTNKSKNLIILILLALVLTSFVFTKISRKQRRGDKDIIYQIEQGDFEVLVNSTGELESENSTEITIPSEVLKSIDVWEIKLLYILPEGTLIDSGAIVAELDPSIISEKLMEIENNLQDLYTNLENAKADTALELSRSRDDILNQFYEIEELEVTLQQSIYESPSIIKQAEMNLEKAKRKLAQSKKSHDLQAKKSEMQISRSISHIQITEKRKQKIVDIFERIKIKSPGKGMLIYYKNNAGEEMKTGATVQVYADNVIATIPNFSSMISRTYVNEIDISKIKLGQKVEVGADAYPDDKYTGTVIQIANIGEEIKGGNAKVFEVIIRLDSFDSFLRPGMTTSNKIIISSVKDKIYVPLVAIHYEKDKNFVYLVKGMKIKKHEVILGETNENFAIVEKGLSNGELVLLNIPDNSDKLSINEL
jgi:HlyD family secretion protein